MPSVATLSFSRATRAIAAGTAVLLAASLAGCAPDYSPNTYASSAVQQANKVDKGVIIGVRPVGVTAAGVTGAAVGGAAGGALGAQAPGGGVTSTLGAIGGGLVGGLIGTSVEHTTGDTTAFEYIVRKSTNELVSVTQKDATPLTVGLHVLVIAGPQARIVQDYTVDPEPPVAALTPPPSPQPGSPPPSGTPAPTTAAPAATATATEPPPAPVSTAPLAPPPPDPTAAQQVTGSVLGQPADPPPPLASTPPTSAPPPSSTPPASTSPALTPPVPAP